MTSITVTPAQAKALRNADAICFDHDAQDSGTVRAILRAENPKNALGFEQTVYIPVESSRVNDYSGASGEVTAFAMISSAQHDDVARTIVRRMKAGTRLAFVWTRDNSSPVTREAGIVVDFLDLKVYNTAGTLGDTFRVGTYIGYDNSARMVKRGVR